MWQHLMFKVYLKATKWIPLMQNQLEQAQIYSVLPKENKGLVWKAWNQICKRSDPKHIKHNLSLQNLKAACPGSHLLKSDGWQETN